MSSPVAPSAALAALSARFGDRLRVGTADRAAHAQQLTWLPQQPPDAVLAIRHLDEIVDALTICNEHAFPVVPFGAGTSLEGQVNAPQGGLALVFSEYQQIVEIVPEDLYAVVQPGVTRQDLNRRLRDLGLFFAVDPGSNATIGGMASTRASGTNAVRYGTMRHNVLAANVVLASGDLLRIGTRAPKSAAGYDLISLFVGAEGTLGVFSELAVRLCPIPECELTLVCQFDALAQASQTVIDAARAGVNVARIELLDRTTVRACNAYSPIQLDVSVTLLAEFHGYEQLVGIEAQRFRGLAHGNGALALNIASSRTEARRIWEARHNAWWAIHRLYPGRTGVTTDTCVPVSRLTECVEEASRKLKTLDLDAAIVGHVGDGNFHVLIMLDPADASSHERAKDFIVQLNELAWQVGGTCTGEHGIGQGKRDSLALEHASSIGVMRALKSTLDPRGILNPGKLV